MKSDRWFLCGRQVTSDGDELDPLRRQLVNLYTAGRVDNYSLVVVAVAPVADGFDRLAIRLSYTRILGEITTAPAAMTGTELAVSLIDRDRNLSSRLAMLRMRLGKVTDATRPPPVWLERLPAQLATALELLDELCE